MVVKIEETKPVFVRFPIDVYELLRTKAFQKNLSQRKILVQAFLIWTTTDLDWQQSKERARITLTIEENVKGSAREHTLSIDVAAALKLRNELTEKLEALGIKEEIE